MRIPRRWLETYSARLDAVTERGRMELVDMLSSIEWDGDYAALRERAAALLQSLTDATCEMCARIAAEFYDGLRAKFGIADGFSAIVDFDNPYEANLESVRAFVQIVVDGRPFGDFVDRCVERMDAQSRRAANQCVERNARRDPRRPRYARIPTGAETCEFCIMLASRGFVYHNPELASHAHANCDCRVVPSWDRSPLAQGYDPMYYFDCYKNPDAHPEIRDAINTRRRELRAERRSGSETAE